MAKPNFTTEIRLRVEDSLREAVKRGAEHDCTTESEFVRRCLRRALRSSNAGRSTHSVDNRSAENST